MARRKSQDARILDYAFTRKAKPGNMFGLTNRQRRRVRHKSKQGRGYYR